jgi:hypothetical protein
LLDSLALVTTSGGTDVSTGLAAIRRGGGEGLVVAVLGRLNSTDLDALAACRHHASSCIAIMLDTASWTTGVTSTGTEEFDRNCRALTTAGWRVLPAPAGADLRELWRSASAGVAAPAAAVPA